MSRTIKQTPDIFITEIYSKPSKLNNPTNNILIKSIDVIWSKDLLDLNDYDPKNNKGYWYILVVIDNFSKYGWTISLQNKTGQKKTH